MVPETERSSAGSGYSAAQSLRGSNQTGMRAYNQRLVLSLIYSHGQLAKTDLARMTSLSAQTVSVIMRELETDSLITRGAPVRGKVGQPSVPFSINPAGAYSFGLKVGRRSAELVLIDFLGRPQSVRRSAYTWPAPEAILTFARNAIGEELAKMGDDAVKRVTGLGVAAPFEMWNWSEQAGAPKAEMDAWLGADLGAALSDWCPFPVYSQNDATAACASELIFGQHASLSNFLYLYIGTFIGGGVVLNGSIYSGRTSNAGALGPLPVTGADGKTVQLLDLASAMTLEKMIRAAGRDPSPLWDSPDNWDSFQDLIDKWIPGVAHALAWASISAASIIDFEHVVIDGALPAPIRERIVAETQRQALKFDLRGLELPRILPGTIGAIARALGAAALPLFDRFLIDRNALQERAQPEG